MSIGAYDYEVEKRLLRESQSEVLAAVTKVFFFMRKLVEENQKLRLTLEKEHKDGIVFPFRSISADETSVGDADGKIY